MIAELVAIGIAVFFLGMVIGAWWRATKAAEDHEVYERWVQNTFDRLQHEYDHKECCQ